MPANLSRIRTCCPQLDRQVVDKPTDIERSFDYRSLLDRDGAAPASVGADVPYPITDPMLIESIEAELMLTVFEARRRARLALLGVGPLPTRNPRALRLLRAARSRRDAPRVSAPAR